MQSSFQNQHSKIEQKALQEIQSVRNVLLKDGYLVDEPTKKQYNYEINISNGKDKLKFLAYFGKKGIKNVLQGNLNSDFYKKIDAIINSKFNFKSEEITEPENYIGSDESGKGDFFGPLVVTAFAFDNKIKSDLSDLNIKDSKELSDDDIRKISFKIRERFSDRISVIEIKPKRYNELYESFKNLNSILIWAHTKAIGELLKKFNYTNLVIDKFCNEDLIRTELNKKLNNYNLLLTEKAERFNGVAIASIIARERLLFWFERKSAELKLELPLGASEKVNNVASHIKEKFGNEVLSELIKFHFKNFKNI
ncbi:Ribonuclease HIII [Ignavibacterium album JCM 16511]|uniref:Ribonuclease n=1 Tax=Ignavibacterium album (strain DSM 19864 / JCM 16511 / NBRC 101810 / Mat9-16) TaxID=945713 RepID=I0AL29_IGNAJ|nr:ribonuclease HIII [Ignavibacterium album]AFH49686.1 Ribonuclease HIII [Ignavibacterium album JCM 16511]